MSPLRGKGTPVAAKTSSGSFVGEHYAFSEVAPGCFAAVAGTTGLAGSNSVIVDLGDRTLLVDCGLTTTAGRELCAAAEFFTGRAVSLALNTHQHSDHCWGNGALPRGTELYATAGTRQLLLTAAAGEAAWYRAHAPIFLAHVAARENRLPAGPSALRTRLAAECAFWECALAQAQEPPLLRLPTAGFERRLTLYGSHRQVDLVTHGGGHSRSDAVLWVADAALLVTGDLVTSASHPWMGSGVALEWLRILATLQTLQPACVIPGHGAPGEGALLEGTERYLRAIMMLAEGAPVGDEGDDTGEAAGVAALTKETERWIQDVSPESEYDGWAYASFFALNLRHEVDRLYGR